MDKIVLTKYLEEFVKPRIPIMGSDRIRLRLG
jgi:hypothetical protein